MHVDLPADDPTDAALAALLRLMLDQAALSVALTDLDDRVIAMSLGAIEGWGLHDRDGPGQSLAACLPGRLQPGDGRVVVLPDGKLWVFGPHTPRPGRPGLAHELRTPINAIMGFTELALAGDVGAVEAGYLKTVQAETKRLLGLIDAHLDGQPAAREMPDR